MRKFHLTLAFLGIVCGWTVRQMVHPGGAAKGVADLNAPSTLSAESHGAESPAAATASAVSATALLPATATVPNAAAPAATQAGQPAGRPQEWDRFEQWLDKWRAAGADEKLALEEEGVFLAEERAAVLKGLMQIDPKLAFDLGIPLRDYVALPASVQAKMERPFNVQTSFDVLRSMSVDENGWLWPTRLPLILSSKAVALFQPPTFRPPNSPSWASLRRRSLPSTCANGTQTPPSPWRRPSRRSNGTRMHRGSGKGP